MAVTPDTRNSIVITKSFSYRGAGRRWSNRYHFEGDLPADDAAWTLLADHITSAEVDIYDGNMEIVEAVGYDSSSATPTNPHGDAVFTKSYSLPGTGVFSGGGNACPGDCAAFVRYSTPARSTKNHPVYLSNYYHGVYADNANQDNVVAAQISAYDAYADLWLAGFSDGTGARQRCGPRGAVAISRTVSSVVRHRDFPG